MSPLTWFCAGFGTCIAVVILLAVAVDIQFIRAGETTISERCLIAGQRNAAIAVAVTAALLTPVLLLIGHLLLGQRNPPADQ